MSTTCTLRVAMLALVSACASAAPASVFAQAVDHSKMDHSRMDHSKPAPAETSAPEVDHSTMDHSKMGHESPAVAPTSAPLEPIPALTDADRAAAFPKVAGHAAHDRGLHSFWLIDNLETWDDDGATGLGWDASAWIGGDLRRLWLRSEGETFDGDIEAARIEVLYGRSVSAWWDIVAGVRHDFGEDPSQSFAALGVVGLAPYKFEVQATAYLGQNGQTAASLEAEYETLLSNRLILQWQAGAEAFGRDDVERGIGSGLATLEAGLRLRYEFTRRFAPYIGLVWERSYGNTAQFQRARGEHTEDTRVVAGIRFWF